jgi:hypothetical protein
MKSYKTNENNNNDTAISCGVVVRKVMWWCGYVLVVIRLGVVEIEKVGLGWGK